MGDTVTLIPSGKVILLQGLQRHSQIFLKHSYPNYHSQPLRNQVQLGKSKGSGLYFKRPAPFVLKEIAMIEKL